MGGKSSHAWWSMAAGMASRSARTARLWRRLDQRVSVSGTPPTCPSCTTPRGGQRPGRPVQPGWNRACDGLRPDRIWDVSTNRTILTLTGHSATINSVAFSPDGTRVASASDDRTIRIYDLDTERLIRIAQSRLTRQSHVAECRQYLHTDSCPSSDGGATMPSGNWDDHATDDSAPVGAYRLTVLPSDFPPGYEAAEDRIGVYTLSLEMGRWRLFQLKPSGRTWETSGTYRVGPGRRLFLTDRGDPGSAWSGDVGELVSGWHVALVRNARATMTPTCRPGSFQHHACARAVGFAPVVVSGCVIRGDAAGTIRAGFEWAVQVSNLRPWD